ncbi:hypothetical protein [Nocardia concava]|uniref:hypothetical protein n=1 Tax=Nocardia concava TaxID=257281 RepID=UPI0002FD59D7|nr:hypothetical protein [Nocardia concava]
MRSRPNADPIDPIADLRANLNLLRYSVEQMAEAMKGILQDMRNFDARLSALEAQAGAAGVRSATASTDSEDGPVGTEG